ncbi:MAG: 4Fe-4S binding protein [bacterium]
MKIAVKPSTSIINKTGSWRSIKPKFLHDKCSACGICQRICPENAIHQTGEKYYDGDLSYCKGCGLCAAECPFKAIEMEPEEK